MPTTNVTREFELSDGRTLSCAYSYHVTPGNYSGPYESSYPDEVDEGEPEYELDGNPVEVAALPKGLEVIAEAMYEADQSDKRFSYKEDQDDSSYEEASFYDY